LESKKNRIIPIIGFLLIISVVFCGMALADKSAKVLILPFNINSEKDMSFLKNGIMDMLTTRLTLKGKAVPLTREETQAAMENLSGPVTEKTAASLGKKFGAAYVVFGSLTVFGDSISTDAKFFDRDQNKSLVTFYESGKDSSDVISHINVFAARINEDVFGSKSSLSGISPKKKQTDESRKHPDAIWADAKNRGAVPAAPSERLPVIASENAPVMVGAAWKSRSFSEPIRGLDLGDVDGDGKNETVFISERKVFIYRYAEKRFAKLGEIEEGPYDTFIGVGVADINQNGRAEIFVTNIINNRQKPFSFVLEWNGTSFARIAEDAGWYYRVLDISGQDRILLGQKGGMSRPFIPGVYELKWSGGEYVSAGEQTVPRDMNIYAFTYGDVFNDGQERLVAFTKNELLQVVSRTGDEEWKSSDRFGGSAAYLEFPDESSATIGNVKEMERIYLPQRIILADPDKDGKNEIIVTKNTDVTRRIFSRFRMFKSGHIECLAWNNLGFYQKWKTAEISGHISDYTVGDMTNDGEDELVFCVIVKKSSVLGKAKSFIAFQKFPSGK